jgi:phage terminase large subunit-like protein
MKKASKRRQPSRSDDVIAFIQKFLIVPEGSHVGRPVRLRDWQKHIIRQIYDTPTRQAIVSMGRKNGKTSLIAMLMLAHLVGPEARRNAQIYSAAQSRDQAGIVFGLGSKMVRMSPELNDPEIVVVRESAKELFSPLTGVRYKALSADATTAYGFSPVLVIHDELGQVRGERSELYDALETAMGAQVEPLSIVISTQAPTALDLLSKLIDDAKTRADQKRKLVLFAAEDEDAIDDEATWRKANPALGDFLNLDELRGLAATAVRMPSAEATFRNLNLNQRVAALNQLFSPSVWEANGGAPDLSVFESEPVYGALDLSGKQDLTALILIAKRDGKWHVWPHFWTPAGTLRERAARDRAPYDVWVEREHLTEVPGVTIDYGFVARRIATIAGKCDLRVIRYDRWRIDDLRAALSAIGCDVPLEECGQGFRDMGPAIDALEVECLQGNLLHGKHPVLTWNAANAIIVPDPAGNRKFEKVKATGRIDGMVALAMAVGAGTTGEADPIRDLHTAILARGGFA